VEEWITSRPDWVHVQDPTGRTLSVPGLDPDELAAIALAEELEADALLMDERDGRREAERRGLPVLGTLRVLADAAEHGLTDLQTAFDRLRQTNFRVSEQLFRMLLDREAARKRSS
jgi:predicted nucleic acid-binding protein